MNKSRATALIAIALLTLPGAASAADPKMLYGSWIEHLPDGGGMVTTFTETTISEVGVNAAGSPITTPMTLQVSYRDLGPSIGVDFKDGGGLLVAVRGPAAITLAFPDAGAHDLVPWRPPAAPTAPKAKSPGAKSP
jgi:hypothetical protein